jgi:hypothetical protein
MPGWQCRDQERHYRQGELKFIVARAANSLEVVEVGGPEREGLFLVIAAKAIWVMMSTTLVVSSLCEAKPQEALIFVVTKRWHPAGPGGRARNAVSGALKRVKVCIHPSIIFEGM